MMLRPELVASSHAPGTRPAALRGNRERPTRPGAEIPPRRHGTRRVEGSALRGSANPRAVQALMRHAKPDLTLSIYARLRPGEEREALDLLPG